MDKEIRQLQEMAGIMIARPAPSTIAIPDETIEEELDEILDEFDVQETNTIQGGMHNREFGPIPGLEGPYRAKNGRIYYYDPQEGAAYDPETDIYMSDEEYMAMMEEVIGDLQNGYDEHHKTSKYHSDYFPSGATSPASKSAGPASAKHGDNPMQKKDFPDDIHEELVYKYRNFLSE